MDTTFAPAPTFSLNKWQHNDRSRDAEQPKPASRKNSLSLPFERVSVPFVTSASYFKDTLSGKEKKVKEVMDRLILFKIRLSMEKNNTPSI